MRRNVYLEQLRAVPELRDLARRDLIEIGRLAETVEGSAATAALSSGAVVLASTPNRVLFIERRAWPRALELAPGLAAEHRRAS